MPLCGFLFFLISAPAPRSVYNTLIIHTERVCVIFTSICLLNLAHGCCCCWLSFSFLHTLSSRTEEVCVLIRSARGAAVNSNWLSSWRGCPGIAFGGAELHAANRLCGPARRIWLKHQLTPHQTSLRPFAAKWIGILFGCGKQNRNKSSCVREKNQHTGVLSIFLFQPICFSLLLTRDKNANACTRGKIFCRLLLADLINGCFQKAFLGAGKRFIVLLLLLGLINFLIKLEKVERQGHSADETFHLIFALDCLKSKPKYPFAKTNALKFSSCNSFFLDCCIFTLN